jgi:hypothetical protein
MKSEYYVYISTRPSYGEFFVHIFEGHPPGKIVYFPVMTEWNSNISCEGKKLIIYED